MQAYSVDLSTKDGLNGPFFMNCLLCCVGAAINRGKIRTAYSVEGNFIGDCLCHWCCGPCAVLQEFYEVKRREGMR